MTEPGFLSALVDAGISTLLQIRGLLGLQTPPSRFAMAVGTVTGNPDQFGAAGWPFVAEQQCCSGNRPCYQR